MTPQQFIRRRKPAWERLEGLLDEAEGRGLRALGMDEIEAIARLYRRATSDLAYARSFYPRHKVVAYLNPLASRAHHQVYQTTRADLGRVKDFLLRTFPCTVRAHWRAVAAAAAILVATAVYGFILTVETPAIADLFMPPAMQAAVQEGKLWTEEIFSVSPGSVESSKLMTNNISVTFSCFALGFLFGLGTIYVLALNGLLLGVIFGYCHVYGMAGRLFDFVVGHGLIELSSITLAAAAGMVLGGALLHPDPYSRKVSMAVRGKEAVTMVFGCIPILVVAGLVEAYISPRPELPTVWKAATGLLLMAAMASYIAFGGRGREAAAAGAASPTRSP